MLVKIYIYYFSQYLLINNIGNLKSILLHLLGLKVDIKDPTEYYPCTTYMEENRA